MQGDNRLFERAKGERVATLIDPAQPIPIYFQLKTLLLEEILSGRYAPGERLPTEHELCGLYGISRTPVTRALSELAQDGVILRHREGAGNSVRCVGAGVGRIVRCSSHASTGCFGTSSG